MITFKAMRLSSTVKALIIGIALAAISACSLLRLSYANGPALVVWWLDGYLDLDSAQEADARARLGQWFAWHRSTRLAEDARWLAGWRDRAAGEVGADEVCRWDGVLRERWATMLQQGLPAAADWLPALRPAQLDRLAAELASRLADERRERAPADVRARAAAALEHAVERAEQVYGALSEAQRSLLGQRLTASPMDAAAWLADRERRQQRFLAELRRAHAQADATARLGTLQLALQTLLQPADAQVAVLQARWRSHNCETLARLHASASAAQRQQLRQRLAGWEEDLRALALVAAD